MSGIAETAERIVTPSRGVAENAWLHELRSTAHERFQQIGIPSSKHEEWRFTPLQGLAALVASASPHLCVSIPSVFSHGVLPDGVRLLSLADAIASEIPEVVQHLGRHAKADVTPFAALNLANFADGAVLVIPDNVVIGAPIHIAHRLGGTANAMHSPRTLIVAGRNSQAMVVEHFSSSFEGEYFTNAVCEIVMAEGARLEHHRLQKEGPAAWHIGITDVDQARDSHYRSFTLALGARLSRHNLHAHLRAPNIETLLYGLYLPTGQQLVDNHTAIFHDAPNCNSWEVYKGILADHSRAVFNGKVFVQSEAQKTDAKQTNRNLLLSDTARVDTKPQLEIFADDVKCTHGATIGKPDPLQTYYLQTRGIGGKVAQAMLLTAFAAEVLSEITSPDLRAQIETDVRARLFGMTR